MKKTLVLFVALCCVMAVFSQAATIIVPTNQPTIAAAIAAAASGDIISVNPGTYVNDTIAIVNKSLTIIGNGARPVVTVAVSPTQFTATDVSAGVLVTMSSTYTLTSMNVTLQNLTIIPATQDFTATRANKGILANTPGQTTGNGTTLNLTMTDVLVTANDGTNNPLSPDGLSFVPYTPATVPWRDDNMFFRGNVNSTLTRVVSTNGRPTGTPGASASPDGYVADQNIGYTSSLNGCIISFQDRIGIQIAPNGSITNIVGTATSRNLFISNGFVNHGNSDITIFCGAGVGTTGSVNIAYTDVIAGQSIAIQSNLNGNNGIPLSISNCRLVSSSTIANDILDLFDSAYGQLTINNCTFYLRSSSNNCLGLQSGTTTAAVITNCIFALDTGLVGGTGINNLSITGATAIVSFTSIVTTGSNALSTITAGAGNAAISLGSGVIYSNPAFVSVNASDRVLSSNNFFGQPFVNQTLTASGGKYLVDSSASYATAGVGGTPLKGGAGYATGGIYLTWVSNSAAIATLVSSGGSTAVFSVVTSGTGSITITSVDGQTVTIAITGTGTSAPLAPDFDISMALQSRKIEMP